MNKGVQIIVQQNDSVLLMKRQNTGYCDSQYGFPSGKVEQNEEVYAAAIREAFEEIGILLQSVRLVTVLQEKDWEHHIMYAEKWTGIPQNKEPGKCELIGWYGLSTLPSDIIPYVKDFIQNILA